MLRRVQRARAAVFVMMMTDVSDDDGDCDDGVENEKRLR
jgi:hypothetical protein